MFASSRPSAAKPHATSESFLVWTQNIVSNLSVLNRNWAVFPSHCHQALLIGLWVLEVYLTCLQATAVVNQRCINTTDLNYFQSFCFVFCYFAFACRMTSIWLFHAGLNCRSQHASQFPIQTPPLSALLYSHHHWQAFNSTWDFSDTCLRLCVPLPLTYLSDLPLSRSSVGGVNMLMTFIYCRFSLMFPPGWRFIMAPDNMNSDPVLSFSVPLHSPQIRLLCE